MIKGFSTLTQIKIQMKVYDETGRRIAVEEAYFKDDVDIEVAVKYIKTLCTEIEMGIL